MNPVPTLTQRLQSCLLEAYTVCVGLALPVRVRRVLLAVPVASVLVDVALRFSLMSRWPLRYWAAYATSVLLGLVGWMVLGTLALRLATGWGRRVHAFALLHATSVALLVLLTTGYFGEFSDYPTWSDVVFLISEAENLEGTLGLMADSFDVMSVGLPTLAFVLTLALWRRVLLPHASAQVASARGLASGVVACSIVLLVRVGPLDTATASPPLENAVVTGGLVLKHYQTRSRGRFHAAERRKLENLPPAPGRPNVLLLLHESLSRNHLSLYGYPKPTTPALQRYRELHPRELFVFERALTNSSNTSVSVPSILLGVEPGASIERFHAAPTLWHHAEAAGYGTFFLSAQSWRYADLAKFLLSSPPHAYWTAEPEHGVQLSNGGGMDDEAFLPRVLEQLRKSAADPRPFFGVVQWNATHHPFLRKPPLSPEFDVEERRGRYDNAIRVLDQLTQQLFDELAALGLLDQTVILLTADHGENHGEHTVHRTMSFHEEVATVPFLVHVPEQQRRLRPADVATLEGATKAVVQNLDVAPTLLDFMLGSKAMVTQRAPEFDGQSLLSPLPEARVIIARNVAPIRRWANEGFALNLGSQRYVFTEWWGEQLFDLAQDPAERSNLLPEVNMPSWVSETITARPELADVYHRHCELRGRCAAQ